MSEGVDWKKAYEEYGKMIGKQGEKKLTAIEVKHLFDFCRRYEIDTRELDLSGLTYNENKQHLQEISYGLEKVKEMEKNAKALKEKADMEGREREEEHYSEVQQKAIEEIKKSISPTINQYFRVPVELIKILPKSQEIHALILESETGLGKSHICCQTLSEMGLEYEKDFIIINGHISPLELYHTIYKAIGKIIIIDDVGEIFENPTSVYILLSALFNPTGKRMVGWSSTSDKLEAPSQFEFRGKVIICCNRFPERLEALKSRCFYYQLRFSYNEKIRILYEIAKLRSIPFEVVDYIKERTNEAYSIDFRLAIKLFELYRNNKDWKELADEIFETDETLLILRSILKSEKSVNEKIREFAENTGLSRATFFRYKNKLECRGREKVSMSQSIKNAESSTIDILGGSV